MNPPRDATIQVPVFSHPEASIREWSDYAHPCLLLEMRRGVRTSLFVLCFLGLHLLVLGGLLVQLTLPDTPSATGMGGLVDFFITCIFWLCVVPPFVLALPFASLFTLSQDIHLRMLETILMTRLGPVGVVIGKWSSKALEAGLMVCTLMPYTVARYYIYGSNPVIDVINLLSLMVVAWFLCAAGVALSTVRSVVMRIVAAVLVAGCFLPVLHMGLAEIVMRSMGPGLSAGLASMPYIICLLSLLGVVVCIGYGACEIGPAAFNGALLPRVTALLFVLPWLVGMWGGLGSELMVVLQVAVGLMLFVPMLLEEVEHEDGVRPYVVDAASDPSVWKALKLPGWQAGVWWMVAAMTLWLLPVLATLPMTRVSATGFKTGLEVVCYMAAPCMGALTFPFVIIRAVGSFGLKKGLFAIRPISAFLYFICITLICVGLAVMLYALDNDLPAMFFFAPPLQLAGLMMNGNGDRPHYAFFYVAGIWPVFVLLAASIREYQRMVSTKGKGRNSEKGEAATLPVVASSLAVPVASAMLKPAQELGGGA